MSDPRPEPSDAQPEQPDEQSDQLVVADAPEEDRFEARLGGALAGFAAYRLRGDRIIFTHTEVDPAYEGRGVGSALARAGLDSARERGLVVVAQCPFVSAYLHRHPEYADLTG